MHKITLNSELKIWPFVLSGLLFGFGINAFFGTIDFGPTFALVSSLVASVLFGVGLYLQTKRLRQNTLRTNPPKDISGEIIAEGDVQWALSSEDSGLFTLTRSPGYCYCTQSDLIYLPAAQLAFQKTFKAKRADIVEILTPAAKEIRIRFNDGRIASMLTPHANQWVSILNQTDKNAVNN